MIEMDIEEVRYLNRKARQHFFDDDTMRFFRSRIESELIEDKFFITSEQFVSSSGEKSPRKFSVRDFNKETGDIHTIGEFQEFQTKVRAVNFAKCMVKQFENGIVESIGVERCREFMPKEKKQVYGKDGWEDE